MLNGFVVGSGGPFVAVLAPSFDVALEPALDQPAGEPETKGARRRHMIKTPVVIAALLFSAC